MKEKGNRVPLSPRITLWPLLRKHIWPKILLGFLILIIIFGLGVEVGNGRLKLSSWLTGHSNNANLPSQLDYASVTKVYQALKNDYSGTLSPEQLLNGLKEGLAQSTGDPYTEYFNASQAKQFNDELNNRISGIGAELGKNSEGDLIVVSPIKGFPAYTAGLQPQDVIATINGQTTSGMSLETAVNKIRGPADTKVTLGIIRNQSQNLMLTITRQNIHIPSVMSKTLTGNIGYIAISSFADDTAGLVQQTARQFKQANVRGVILDLRGDPGGLLNEAVSVSSVWLPEGRTVVTEKGTIGTNAFTATGNDILQGMPTVVLIDEGSASASEITAGALHDNKAAQLIGTKSFGKGVVQQVVTFSDGSELKVTVASWYRPDGENINKKGITPDQIVAANNSETQAGNDVQLSAAEAYLSR